MRTDVTDEDRLGSQAMVDLLDTVRLFEGSATVDDIANALRWSWTDVYCRLSILAYEEKITFSGRDNPVAC